MNATKFPRTYHLPFSEGRSSDDKILKSLEHLEGEESNLDHLTDLPGLLRVRDHRRLLVEHGASVRLA